MDRKLTTKKTTLYKLTITLDTGADGLASSDDSEEEEDESVHEELVGSQLSRRFLAQLLAGLENE